MMKTVLYLSLLAAFIAIGTGTGTAKKCYQCDDCNDVSGMNMTVCEGDETHCKTSYRNDTGVITNVTRACTSASEQECVKEANEALILCVCVPEDGCNNMTFPVPTTIATTTAGFERHCATAISTLIAVTVTGFLASLF